MKINQSRLQVLNLREAERARVKEKDKTNCTGNVLNTYLSKDYPLSF